MKTNYPEINNEEFLYLFEDHDCKQNDGCSTCIEYLTRFNPQRLLDEGIDEDSRVNDTE